MINREVLQCYKYLLIGGFLPLEQRLRSMSLVPGVQYLRYPGDIGMLRKGLAEIRVRAFPKKRV